MASWHSVPLEITFEVLGWLAFVSWSISFYPQVILDFYRKSVIGLNFDFVLLNLTKHSSYLLYNAVLYFSPAVQKQYLEKYGLKEQFSIHAVLLTAITLFQTAIYDRGNQKISKISIGIVSVAWLAAAVCFFCCFALTFLALVNLCVQLNSSFHDGYQIYSPDSRVNFCGNIGKTLLSLVSVSFDILFRLQHYVLYPAKSTELSVKLNGVGEEPLIKASDQPTSKNV